MQYDPETLLFRQATNDDIREIATWIRSRRECEFWAGPYLPYPLDAEWLPADLELFTSESLVLLDDQHQLLAFGQLQEKDVRNGHLARLIVNPDHRRCGHGRFLVQALLELARTKDYRCVTLNVDRENRAARTLYRQIGFRYSRRPAGEYASPQSEYMSLELPGHS